MILPNHPPDPFPLYFSRDHFLIICLSEALFFVRSNCQMLLHFHCVCYENVASCAAL